MHSIALLRNPVMEYPWGSRTAIPALLGLPVPSEAPMAELWMGAHPRAPSRALVDGLWQPLDRVIDADPVAVLGRAVAERFGRRLPFLFKVLAAERPLSIQVHPDLEQAREGFERENRLGIPVDAPERNYRDPNHKPEILCALTPFEALKGFRKPGEIARLIAELPVPSLSGELDRLRDAPDERRGLEDFFRRLITLDRGPLDRVIREAASGAERGAGRNRALFWVRELAREYPGDPGVLSPLVMNLVELEPGQAIHIPAGQLHAYLGGTGVELMANSDNVLRGGLTRKHVDPPELLKIVNFVSGPVDRVRPLPGLPGEKVYQTPAREFELSEITVGPGTSFESAGKRSVEILICTKGRATVKDGRTGRAETLERGGAIIVPAAVGSYEIQGEATLYRASVGMGGSK